jgi:hypothetical protein
VAGKGAARASVRLNGSEIEHLFEPRYHVNPIGPAGCLVTYDWGYDIAENIDGAAPFSTTIEAIENVDIGALTEVIVSIRHRG